jgi:hypothetical protein
MVDRLASPVEGNSILLFGPQALSLDAEAFQRIRATVLSTEKHHWILDTIAELPECVDIISKARPDIVAQKTRKLLEDLNAWFKTGHLPDTPFILPNTLLTPLVIIAQLTQYTQYLELSNPNVKKDEDIYALPKDRRETLGFCTGLLSALAVSSSRNKEQFRKYGAVALRLGMLIGIMVDSQDASSETGPSKSLATVWNSVASRNQIARILEGFPEVRMLQDLQASNVFSCYLLTYISGICICVL